MLRLAGNTTKNTYNTKIYGHRGASEYAPENTMEAFKLAYEMGADGIEFDVQMSKDGYVVVIHDETLDRTSDGSGFVRDYTLAELKKFDFGKPRTGFCNVKIPTLQEVLEEFKNTEFLLNIELKNSIIRYPGLEEKVLKCVADFGCMERTLFSSFSHPSMMKLRTLRREAEVAFLFMDDILEVADYMDKYNVNTVHPATYLCEEKETIDMYHSRGKVVNVWTVNRGSDIRRYCDMGVDGIITNKPDLGVEIKHDKKA